MKRAHILLFFCVMAVLASSAAFAYDNRPIVVMREDDGWLNCRDRFPEFGGLNFLELGKQLNIPITWAVITDRVSARTTLSWAEYIDYVSTVGGELASHSATHQPMSSLQAYADDIVRSKAAIEANTPYKCNTLLQPGTWKDDAFFDSYTKIGNVLWQAIQNNFVQSQLYLSTIGIGSPVYMHGLGASIDIDYVSRPVCDDFLKSLDYVAQTPGLIYVIQFHGIQSPTGTTDYCTRSDLMAALLPKLNQLRNDGKIRMLSMNDAYNNNQFSPDVNRLFDPGFEFTQSELSKYLHIWILTAGDTIVDKLGYDNSKCAYLVPGGYLRQGILTVPGKYRLAWMQKPADGTPLSATVNPRIATMYPWTDTAFAPAYSNSSNDWEQKSMLFRMPDTFLNILRCEFTSNNNYLLDNVSLQLIPASTTDTVTDFKVTPVPTGMTISWRAPSDTAYSRIAIRYSTSPQCPQTIIDGRELKMIAADNGNVQSVSVPFDWSNQYNLYFSAFAVKSDGTCSEPDVCYLTVDRKKPTVTVNPIIQQSNCANISWKVTGNTSALFTGIFADYYSIGLSSGATDVVGWTLNNDRSAQINNIEPGKTYYLNVRSENEFGFWSDTMVTSFVIGDSDLDKIFQQQNGATVAVTGVVSAIFSDSYYLESENRIRGIKILGPTTSLSLGMTVTVQGDAVCEHRRKICKHRIAGTKKTIYLIGENKDLDAEIFLLLHDLNCSACTGDTNKWCRSVPKTRYIVEVVRTKLELSDDTKQYHK